MAVPYAFLVSRSQARSLQSRPACVSLTCVARKMERSCATVAAIAVVSAVNSPLWLRVYAEDEEPLRLHSLVHCALDSTDERLAAPKKARARLRWAGREAPLTRLVLSQDAASVEAYLGLLSPADEYFTYGYAACSRVKFLLVTDSEARGWCGPLRSSGAHSSRARRSERRTCGMRSSASTQPTWRL